MNPFVTHVASLAGGGPTRLFTLLELCRSGVLYKDVSDAPEQRVQKLVSDWRVVLSDPDSTSKFFLGHPYRTWASFAASSCVAELSRSAARVYVAQGTDDKNVAPPASDVLYTELLAHGRDCTADWVVGADHGFGFPSDPKRDGQRELIRSWFFEDFS